MSNVSNAIECMSNVSNAIECMSNVSNAIECMSNHVSRHGFCHRRFIT